MHISFIKDPFDNLENALERLREVLAEKDLDQNEYMQDSSIRRFRFVIEFYMKVLKKFLAYEKIESTTPRDVLSKAFQFKLIDNRPLAKVLFAINGIFFAKTEKRLLEPLNQWPVVVAWLF